MRFTRLSLILVVGVAVTALQAAPTHEAAYAAFAGGNGRIAFSSYLMLGGVPSQIMTVEADGSDPRALADGVQPAWSPDGKRIAFSTNPLGAGDIAVVNADGSGLRVLTSDADTDIFPGWSPDGKKVAFLRAGYGLPGQVWVVNDDGTGAHQVTNMVLPDTAQGGRVSWSPDGTKILFSGWENLGGPYAGSDLFVVSASGGAATNLTNTPAVWSGLDIIFNSEISGDWSPDGSQIVFLSAVDYGERHISAMNADGSGRHALLDIGQYAGLPSWSPDGNEITYSGGANGDEINIIDASGGGERALGPKGYNPVWQPVGPPVVFIHGFLGSSILCGGSPAWPDVPPDFDAMALAADGLSPAPGACAATVGETIDSFLGSDVYGSVIDYLDKEFGVNASLFAWDWRKSPEPSLAELDAFIDNVRTQRNADKVVLMAHSYGGLLARWYIDSPSRADKVAGVVTIGTPAWGAPKAIFPLFAGVETPDFSALDAIMPNDELKDFARNLFGNYFLYPSASYGPWLTLLPSSTPAGQQDLLNYVGALGGNPGLLSQALSRHGSTLDGVPANVPFEVVVGAGLPTIAGVRIDPNGHVIVEYDNGDGTVPAVSAARGQPGPGNPNAAHTHYACGIGHVPLPGHQLVTDAIEPFLRSGDPVDGLSDTACAASGLQFRIFNLSALPAVRAAGVDEPAAITPEEADRNGDVDYLDLPEEKFIITGETFPEMTLPAGEYLEITRIGDDGAKGEALLYGPFTGQVTVSPQDGWALVLEDGEPVEGEPAVLSGDVDCSSAVNSIDALKLLRHIASLDVVQTQPCPGIGTGDATIFGDVDCDGSVTAVDALFVLRFVAALPANLPAGCRQVGT